MSLLYTDLFDDIPARLDSEVNPYVSDLIRGQKEGDLPVIYGPALRDIKGNWVRKFSGEAKSNPLVLEIGCHKGNTIRDMATNHSDKNFIGMDITFKRVVMTAQRAKNAGLKNVNVMLGSAKQLELVFADHELDGVIIFYPDPWSKPKQSGNRLVNQEFCHLLKKKIKPGGFFWFKTDQEPYFDATCESIDASGFLETPDPKGLCGEVYETTFERKFRLAGLPTFDRAWVNPTN